MLGVHPGAAGLRQPTWVQGGYGAPKAVARQRVDVVEIHDAVGWDAVPVGGQLDLGDEASASPGERGHNDRADPVGN